MGSRSPYDKRAIISWCFYDWANSAFSAIVLTFIFPVYFTEKIAPNAIIGTAQWGHMIAISSLIMAFVSPLLGAISDHQKRRKPWVLGFTILSVVATALLWFATPTPNATLPTLVLIALGLISMEVGMVFYNALLKSLAPPEYIGRVSGWGWGLGYFGGLLCLMIALLIFVGGEPKWLKISNAHLEHIRICGPLVAIWFGLFSIPLFMYVHEPQAKTFSFKRALQQGLHELWKTVCSLKNHRNIALFLIAHLLYIDGLNTIFAFGGIYAANTFGMSATEVIKLGIAMNVAAGVGAIGFAWLDDFWGSKLTLLSALLLMILTGLGLLITELKWVFWLLCAGLCIGVGPVQAASRSLMTRLTPPKITTQLFGIYALSGKITTFIGPWLLAWMTLRFNSQRVGMSTTIGFLIIGAALLLGVKTNGGNKKNE